MNNLGYLYDNGIGVLRDYTTARKWYEAAAKQGNVEAQFNLGQLYTLGHGTVQDYGKPPEWLEKPLPKATRKP